jgi:hypothetical protein
MAMINAKDVRFQGKAVELFSVFPQNSWKWMEIKKYKNIDILHKKVLLFSYCLVYNEKN